MVSVVQSPAVDVVGVGLESGGVVMHNLRYDETIVRFQQDWGPVTTLSFRSGEWLACVCLSVCLYMYMCV